MAPEPIRLLDLAEAVADGREVDWGEAETTAGSDTDRNLIRQLRLLAGVADTHRAGPGDADHPAADPLIGTRWGSLEISELVGAGSFGSVYRARDVQLDREVALKIIRGTLPNGEEVLREGQLLARIRHPHVVTVHGADLIDGRVGLWMEFIEGRTLEDVLRQDGPLSAREAALVGIELCSALAAVHAQGLIHRDIKTRNVMREAGGRIVLMDFGAGRDQLTSPIPGPITGTPLYMAPEVLRGGDSNRQSDLYSLGVLLFRLVSGRYPVEGRSTREVLDNHNAGKRLQLRDLRPDLPSWFIAAINRTIAPDVSDRFPGPGALESALSPTQQTTWSRSQQVLVGLALAGVLAVVGATVWSNAHDVPTSATGTVSAPVRRIAVRPLKNLTGDATQDYFAAGLTDGLLAQLGAIKALSVTAAAEAKPGQEVAAPPGLYGWLEGSVQRSGGKIRIAARLVQAAGGTVIWGRAYEGTDAEAFMLQGKIAADLAGDLKVSVTETESRRLTRKYVANPQAQDAYLRGRYLLDAATRDSLLKARTEFQAALALDPEYAHAYAGLASAYLELVTRGIITPQEARAFAPTAADLAVAKDPLLAEAVLARADVRFRLSWDWSGAEADYRLAMELNPSDILARGRYVRYLQARGQLQEAERQAREALSIDPLSGDLHASLGAVIYYSGRYEEAVEHYRERQSGRVSGSVGLGRAYAGAGRFPEAIAELRAALASSGGDTSIEAELARTLIQSGDLDQGRQILKKLESQRANREGYVAPQDLAYIHVALGEPDAAFALLSEAIDERASRLLWLRVDPRVAPLKADLRFAALLSRLGIDDSQK